MGRFDSERDAFIIEGADDDEDEDDEEDEAFRAVEIRVLIDAKRDIPEGVAVLRGARVITMNGDEVIVAQGEYFENINFNGKAITVRSTDPNDAGVVMATIINGGGVGSVVTCKQRRVQTRSATASSSPAATPTGQTPTIEAVGVPPDYPVHVIVHRLALGV